MYVFFGFAFSSHIRLFVFELTTDITSLQQNAKHPETFSPNYISLKHAAYVSMVETLHLPYRGIESTTAVGPFFWAAFDQDEEDPHLRESYRWSRVQPSANWGQK